MQKTAKWLREAAWIVSAGFVLAGCTESRLHVGEDFSRAVRQEQAAQLSDPDARYAGIPKPGTNGARVGLAQARYEHNAVIPPAYMTTSTVVGGGNGASGGGAPP
jgi:hypothetical protein